MVDSVISRRARPVRLLAVLRPLPMERPLPADRAYPEALQVALNAWKLVGQDTSPEAILMPVWSKISCDFPVVIF